jgi:hypothetical protein
MSLTAVPVTATDSHARAHTHTPVKMKDVNHLASMCLPFNRKQTTHCRYSSPNFVYRHSFFRTVRPVVKATNLMRGLKNWRRKISMYCVPVFINEPQNRCPIPNYLYFKADLPTGCSFGACHNPWASRCSNRGAGPRLGLYNGKVRNSLQNCGSSVRNLLYVNILVPGI